jgi:hypothetical protein
MAKPNELTPFTFKDTGITILTRRVSPLLMYELRKQFPAPEPPLQKVSFGEDEETYEPNPAHPEYHAAMNKYNSEFKDKAMVLLIKRGTVINWTDEMRGEIAELRKFWMDEYGWELPKDDTLAYIQYICVGSPQDLDEFTTFITTRSQPTEEAVAEAQKFPRT